MQTRIQGTTMPVLEVQLDPNESVFSESGELSWMTQSIQMTTHTQMGGGGGLFGTPGDYMVFLQMLLRGGEFGGARILKPQTVASMYENHIADLKVVEMKTAQPAYSNSCDQFPGMVHKWGLSFDINTQPGPYGRSAGSASWAGLLNCYYWIDPVKKVTGTMFTQLLPFYDARVVDLYGAFERGLYAGLAST